MKETRRKVTFAKVSKTGGTPTLFEISFFDDLQRALDPHAKIERYGHTWRVSRPSISEEMYLTGKLGFERISPSEEVYFDEEKEDFVTMLRPAEQGRFSHFVVNLMSGILVFEERPPDIKRQSFLGAIRKLLRESIYSFDIEVVLEAQAFADWVKTVERIILFDGKFEPPNPQWLPRTKEVRRLIETTNADLMEIKASKIEDSKNGLNIETSVLGEIVEHSESGYGKVRARGIKEGKKRTFRSEENAATAEVVETSDDDSQTIYHKLIRALKERFPWKKEKNQ